MRFYVWPVGFQSSAAPKDGCYFSDGELARLDIPVSILSRPEGRLLLSCRVFRPTVFQFQSSAAPKDGCYDGEVQPELVLKCVSILSRPEGRLLLDWQLGDSTDTVKVSILSRPEGRLLPLDHSATVRASRCFNPQPPRRTAATA